MSAKTEKPPRQPGWYGLRIISQDVVRAVMWSEWPPYPAMFQWRGPTDDVEIVPLSVTVAGPPVSPAEAEAINAAVWGD
jgi:hypothetical protein